MNWKGISVLVFLLTIQSCFERPKSNKNDQSALRFKLIGSVEDLPDPVLILEYSDLNRRDTVQLVQNKFVLDGFIPDTIQSLRAVLRTIDFSDYKFVWLEPNEMTIQLAKGKFREAKVTGSKNQIEDDLYNKMIADGSRYYDSIQSVNGGTKASNKAILEQLEESKKAMSAEFIINHPESLVSSNLLDTYATLWGKDFVSKLYDMLSAKNKESMYGKSVKRYLRYAKELNVGDQYEDIEQTNIEGKSIRLSRHQGKLMLLEFWAAWCAPCREENPNLIRIYNKFTHKGFEIFAVSLDNNEQAWKKAIVKDGLIWDNVSELNGFKNSAALMYGVSAIPDNVLIDKNGIIIDRNLKPYDLERELVKILGQ